MISWLFDPHPVVEWKFALGKKMDLPSSSDHLSSLAAGQPEDSRFPSDTVIHYRTFRDCEGRDSKVAFLEYGPKPKMSSKLVDTCWTNGVPLILWFQEPPSWEAPHWRETLSSRSIQTVEAGRLRWQPIVSWTCEHLDGAIEEFGEWLTKGLPFFPLPIVRYEFAEEIPFEGIGETLLELAANPLPCRFKLFAIPNQHRNRLKPEQWAEILQAFQDPPPTEHLDNQVITLYPQE